MRGIVTHLLKLPARTVRQLNLKSLSDFVVVCINECFQMLKAVTRSCTKLHGVSQRVNALIIGVDHQSDNY